MDTHDLELYRGDTFNLGLDFTEDDEVTAIALSPVGWLAQVRPTPDASAYTELTIDTTLAATGRLVLTLTAEQTAAIVDGSYWDLQQTLPTGVTTYARGRVRVRKDVSRA